MLQHKKLRADTERNKLNSVRIHTYTLLTSDVIQEFVRIHTGHIRGGSTGEASP